MKNKFFSAIWALCCSVVLPCGHSSGVGDPLIEQLTGEVVRAPAGNEPIRMAAVTDFKWDQLFLFAPYTPTEHIVTVTGLNSAAEVESSGIEGRDDITLLVFLADGKLQKWVPFPRGKVDFAGLAEEGPLTPEQAVFTRQNIDTDAVPRLSLLRP